MEKFLDDYGYIALLVGSFFEGETSILIASSLIYRGYFEIVYTVFFGFAGSFISDWIYFTIGRLNGRYFIEKRPALMARIEGAQDFFETHKYQILFTYRFLYGFRVVIPLMIGMSRIRLLEYLFYSIVSGLLWSGVVTTIGYFIGRFLDIKPEFFQENIVYIIAGFATFGMLLGVMVKRIAFKKIKGSPDI